MSQLEGTPDSVKTPAVKQVAHDPCWNDASWRANVRRRLLAWFDRNARDLPWRQESTPYRVWVSEIMLQQTQVATVIDYYNRFLESFPTVDKLADADPQDLLSHWEGLGYYRRARSLHAAAKQVVEQHDGVFPTDYDDVLALPGIGRYTAGAILSISRNARLPILEGNTQRLFSRWIALQGPANDRAATKLLWEVSEAMLPRKETGKFNQAAMELGALVCSPKNPSCDRCPVSRYCQAKATGQQESIPGKVSRIKYEERTEYAMVVQQISKKASNQGYLVRMLPDGGRWAGLWDFPRTTDRSHATVERAANALSSELGVPLSAGEHFTTIRHAVTKFRIELRVHFAELVDAKTSPSRPWRYATVQELEDLPMSVTGRKIARKLQQEHG